MTIANANAAFTAPAPVNNIASTSATAVTGSFSPAAGSLVVIAVNIGYAGYSATGPAVTVKDSNSTAYADGPAVYDTQYDYSGIFWCYYTSAPGSITVTATRTGNLAASQYELVTYVLTGCGSSQSGAGSSTAYSSAGSLTDEGSITTTAAGSWVIAASSVGNALTFTPAGVTTDYSHSDATDFVSGAAGHAVTGTPGPATLGWTITYADTWSWAALEILPSGASVVLPDSAGAADAITAQVTAIPVVLITAPRRSPGPPPPPIRAQILTVPQGNAAPADAAGAAEAMTAGTVTVPLADVAGVADTISAGIYPADAAAATDALAITAVSLPVGDVAGSADTLTAAVQLSTYDNAASIDLGQTTGLTQSDTAAAADKLTAAVTVTLADRAGAVEAIGTEPAIGASGGATRPAAVPGTSQVAVAAPGSSNWVYLGSIGQVTALKYSFTCPGGADSMTCTVMVPASYRNQAFSPGWQVRVTRGGHQVWRGKMDEPVPTASGWNFTAVGNGMRGTDYLAIYTDTWPTGQPDESINGAISRGLPWVNPGVGTPAGAWFGQGVDSGAQTITALLNLVTTRGAMTWYVNSQPGGMPGDDLSVFPLPTVPNRLLIATTPVPRTLGADINTIYIRYEITADNTDATTSTTAPATYGLTVAQNAASVAMHGELETYIDISDVGVMSAGAAQAVGQNVLALYQRASFGGPFTGNYGALMNMGGVPVDPGTDQAGTVVRLILTDFGYGGELVPGPIQFIVGSYEWDDFAQAFTLSAMNTLDHSLTGMLQMTNTTLTPITVAST